MNWITLVLVFNVGAVVGGVLMLVVVSLLRAGRDDARFYPPHH